VITEIQSRVTPLNHAAATHTVDFSLFSNTCLRTSRQNKNAQLLPCWCMQINHRRRCN